MGRRAVKVVGAYARISKANDGLGVERQLDLMRERAEREGWQLQEYVDNGKSGYTRGLKREGYEAMLADIASGQLDAILSYHVDRLFRQDRERLRLYDVCTEASVVLVASVDGSDVYFNTADGRKDFRDRGSAAEYASDRQSERLKRKHEELAKAGHWSGGGRKPFGFTVVKQPGQHAQFVVHEPEAAAIRDAARRVLVGESLHSILIGWNGGSVPKPGGKRWTQADLRRILLSPQVAGIREHWEWYRDGQGRRKRGELLSRTEGAWPAILDVDTYELVKMKLNDPSRKPKTGRPGVGRVYALTGLLHCAGSFLSGKPCGHPLVGHRHHTKGRTYTCASTAGGCGRVRILADRAEDVVLEAVYLRWGELVALGLEKDREATSEPTAEEREMLAELRELEERLDALAAEYATGELKMDARRYNIASTRLTERIESLTQRLTTYERKKEQTVMASVAEALERADDFEKRRKAGELTPEEVQRLHDWVAGVVARIDIMSVPPEKRGRRFNADRVRIEFKPIPLPAPKKRTRREDAA